MSTIDYLTYTALFAVILITQLGRRSPSIDRLLMPVLIVGAIGFKYLVHLPSGTVSGLIELAGVGAGVLFGLASIKLMGVGRDESTGRLQTVAGWPYAAVWTLALVARLGFAFGSTHWFGHALAQFSVAQHVAPTTYAAAFVLMVLTMIVIRTAAVLIRGRRAGADLRLADSRIARRLLSV